MSLFEEVMAVAVKLPMAERERLAQALGVKIAQDATTSPPARQSLPLHPFAAGAARPDAAAWRKAERGHAVLATDAAAQDEDIPAGAETIIGMWAHRHAEWQAAPAQDHNSGTQTLPASALPKSTPVVVHTDVCIELALGMEAATQFFRGAPVEARLATATYLALLGAAEDAAQQRRIRRFVQPYAVLSLGPMASSRAVELMLAHSLSDGLQPLDALIAATALAHEIPLVTCNTQPFTGITELAVYRP